MVLPPWARLPLFLRGFCFVVSFMKRFKNELFYFIAVKEVFEGMYEKILYAVTTGQNLPDLFITNGTNRSIFRNIFGYGDEDREDGTRSVNGLIVLVEGNGSIDVVGPGTCLDWYSVGIGYFPSSCIDSSIPIPLNITAIDNAVAVINYVFSLACTLLRENPIAIVHANREQEFLALAQALRLSSRKVAKGKMLEEVVLGH